MDYSINTIAEIKLNLCDCGKGIIREKVNNLQANEGSGRDSFNNQCWLFQEVIFSSEFK